MKTSKLSKSTLILTTAAMIASANTSFAATLTWDGGGADNNWTTDANWDGAGDDDDLLTFETLNFAGSTRLTANNTTLGGKNVNSILFDASAGAFTLTGEYVDMLGKDTNDTVARGPAYVTNNSANTQTINLSLNNYGGIPYNTGLIFENTAGGNIVVNGIITEQGGGSIIYKNGGGTLELNGNNSFTTNVVVNAGTLKIGHANALGAQDPAATKVTVASGGTVDFNGVGNAGYGYTIAGTGVGGNGALVNNGAAITTGTKQTSNITLSADASIGGTGDWALLAAAWGPTTLDLAGNTLTKSGANTFTLANATVTAGSIQIDEGTLTQYFANKPGGHDLSAVAVSLANTAGATLDLNNLNLSVGSLADGGSTGGNVDLATGTLTVGDLDTSTTYAGVISGTGGLTKTGSGTQTLSGISTYTGATVVNEGTLKLNAAGVATNAGALANTSSITVNSGATLDVAQAWNLESTTAVVIDGGTLNFSSGTVGGGPGANYVNDLTLNNGAMVTGATTNDGIRLGFFGDAAITVGGTSASTISSNVLLVNDAGGNVDLTVNVADATSSSAADLTISGVISEYTGPGLKLAPLIKTGAGTLELTGTNTYTGATNVNAGTLLVNNTSGSGTGTGAVTVDSGATLGGTGTIGGATVLNSGSFISAGDLNVASGVGSLSFLSTLDIAGTAIGTGQNLLFDLAAIGSSDLIDMTGGGALTIGSGLLDLDDFQFTNIAAEEGIYTLFDTDTSIDGSFGTNTRDWIFSPTAGGFYAELSFGEGTNNILLTLSAVPEPSSAALLGLGALAFALRRRRASKSCRRRCRGAGGKS